MFCEDAGRAVHEDEHWRVVHRVSGYNFPRLCLGERSSLSECRRHNYSVIPGVPFACGLPACVRGSAPVRAQPVPSGWLARLFVLLFVEPSAWMEEALHSGLFCSAVGRHGLPDWRARGGGAKYSSLQQEAELERERGGINIEYPHAIRVKRCWEVLGKETWGILAVCSLCASVILAHGSLSAFAVSHHIRQKITRFKEQ